MSEASPIQIVAVTGKNEHSLSFIVILSIIREPNCPSPGYDNLPKANSIILAFDYFEVANLISLDLILPVTLPQLVLGLLYTLCMTTLYRITLSLPHNAVAIVMLQWNLRIMDMLGTQNFNI